MSRTLLAVAAGVLSATLASSAFAGNVSQSMTTFDRNVSYANTGLAGRGTVTVPHVKDRAAPYALTGRRVAEVRQYRTITVGSRIVARVPVDVDNDNR